MNRVTCLLLVCVASNAHANAGGHSIASAVIFGTSIAVFFGWLAFKLLCGGATGKDPKSTARRWMSWCVMLGVIKGLSAGLIPIFAGTSGGPKGFAEGFAIATVLGAFAYVAGYLYAKIRRRTNDEQESEIPSVTVDQGQSKSFSGKLSKNQSDEVQKEPETSMKLGAPEERSVIKAGLVDNGRGSQTARPPTLRDQAIFSKIAKELEEGTVDKGLWTRLFAEADGDETRLKVLYIKERFAILKQAADMFEARRHLREVVNKQLHEEKAEYQQRLLNMTKEQAQEEARKLIENGSAKLFFGACRIGAMHDIERFLEASPLFLLVTEANGKSGLSIASDSYQNHAVDFLIQARFKLSESVPCLR